MTKTKTKIDQKDALKVASERYPDLRTLTAERFDYTATVNERFK